MEDWQWWVALGLTSAVGFWLGIVRDKRKKDFDDDAILEKRISAIEERVAVMEATQVNPQRVKQIVDDSFSATNMRLDKIEHTLEQLTTSMLDTQIAIAQHMGKNPNSGGKQ